jgi:hypothetical protein
MQILQKILDGKSIKIKVVELQMLFNSVVDNIFVRINLLPQIVNLHSVNYNICAIKQLSKHDYIIGGVVEEA